MTNNKRGISTFKFGYPHLTLKEGSKVKSDHTKRFPDHDFLYFQNEAKNIPSQDFVMRNIPCEFEIPTYNTLCSRGPPKVLAKSRKNAHGGHLVFQNEAKNIPRQDFMVMNISCKFEKASYNIFFVRALTVKSLYTLPRRRNAAKSIVSTGYNQGNIQFYD